MLNKKEKTSNRNKEGLLLVALIVGCSVIIGAFIVASAPTTSTLKGEVIVTTDNKIKYTYNEMKSYLTLYKGNQVVTNINTEKVGSYYKFSASDSISAIPLKYSYILVSNLPIKRIGESNILYKSIIGNRMVIYNFTDICTSKTSKCLGTIKGNNLTIDFYSTGGNIDPAITEIPIIDAERLDSKRNFIENIFNVLQYIDNNWTTIYGGQFVRVTFAEDLNSSAHIAIYAKSNGTNISIYEKDNSTIISEGKIKSQMMYRFGLNNLKRSQNIFDIGFSNNVDLDYISDPIVCEGAGSCGTCAGQFCCSSHYECTGNVNCGVFIDESTCNNYGCSWFSNGNGGDYCYGDVSCNPWDSPCAPGCGSQEVCDNVCNCQSTDESSCIAEAPTCSWTPEECLPQQGCPYLETQQQCEDTNGYCRWVEGACVDGYCAGGYSCTGVPDPCSTYAPEGESVCNQHFGCEWNEPLQECQEGYRACAGMYTPESCAFEGGTCTWECLGYVGISQCSQLGNIACESIYGCQLIDLCSYSGTGNFIIPCDANCTITNSYDLNRNNITINGTGLITITSQLSNFESKKIWGNSPSQQCGVLVTA